MTVEVFNAAWEEAEATSLQDAEIFHTLEFRHPAFLEMGEPIAIRVVASVPEDQLFRIEPGAAMNGGELVRFIAVPFTADLPEVAEGKPPEARITIDNVAREMVGHLEAAVKVKADLRCLLRQYRSDDRDEPCYGPVEFVIRSVAVKGAAITGMARLDDLSNTKFPRRVYTLAEFPGLLP